MLNGHGDDGYLFEGKLKANFSSNVYYQGLNNSLKQHLIQQLDKIQNYPEPEAESFIKALSFYHPLPPSYFCATNGATEAFYLIAHAFKGKTATILIPSFSEYEDACRLYNLKIHFQKLPFISEDLKVNTDLFFICNPNNPTGSVTERHLLEKVIGSNPETMFLIDEAYIDFTPKITSGINLLLDHKNLIIIKSLTKAYAIPGLRLGYIAAPPAVIEQLRKVKMPWSVNQLAVMAGIFILENTDELKIPLQLLRSITENLRYKINRLEGFQAFPTSTNFFLCTTLKNTAQELKQYLLKEHSLLIRDASNFRGLSSQHFRVAAQGEIENTLLIKGLEAWISIS